MNVLKDEVLLDFGMENFDIDAAFQGAIVDLATDAELLLDEKVLRIERVIEDANSDFYQGFVDLRNMAAQIEIFCNHDHTLQNALESSESVSSFLNDHIQTSGEHEPKTGEKRTKKLEKAKKKKNKKVKRMSGWALLGVVQEK